MKLHIIYYASNDRPCEPLAICEPDKVESLIADDIQYMRSIHGNTLHINRDSYYTDDWTLNKLWYTKEVTP